MAGNALERAVIENARDACTDLVRHGLVNQGTLDGIVSAVQALEAHERTQDPTVTERGWHEVTEGDHLRSVKNGNFYPVVGILKVQRGKYQVVLLVAGKRQMITRPTPAEPTAWVKRGATGEAVDTITHVFSSQ
jgi:hypothetical protein